MRVPPLYAAFCAVLLIWFGYAKLRGLDYWPGLAGTGASFSSRGSGSRGSSGSGSFFGASSSHK